MSDPKGSEEGSEFARLLFAGPCDFIWGTGDINSLPPQGLPEVAFVGRSNVGKSSLINALTGRKTLARVSQTPGRTRELNFFNLGGKLMLVDLPGYGYAKASKTLAMEWQGLIFAYLAGRATLNRVVLLIDGRRGPMETDLAVMELLDKSAVSYILVLTKTDEMKAPEIEAAIATAGAEARKHTPALAEIFATSALKAKGLDALKTHLGRLAIR
jgi:GTP-binding protein